jgi:hypothetical protein
VDIPTSISLAAGQPTGIFNVDQLLISSRGSNEKRWHRQISSCVLNAGSDRDRNLRSANQKTPVIRETMFGNTWIRGGPQTREKAGWVGQFRFDIQKNLAVGKVPSTWNREQWRWRDVRPSSRSEIRGWRKLKTFLWTTRVKGTEVYLMEKAG